MTVDYGQGYPVKGSRDKIKETQKVRLHIDITLNRGFDASELHDLAKNVELAVVEECDDAISIHNAHVTQIIPAEGDRFDWSKFDGSEADRG